MCGRLNEDLFSTRLQGGFWSATSMRASPRDLLKQGAAEYHHFWFFAESSASFLTSMRATASWPFLGATCSGVIPTAVFAERSAPFSTSMR